MVMIGILPTLEDGHLSPSNVSPNPRYKLLGDQILAARGEDLVIDISGPERLRTTSDSIMPEAACTSTQLHIQVSPDDFAAYWNASQAISGDPARDRRQLAVPAGQAAVARDPDPAVRAGHRHPQRGAQGAGRAAAGLVRRALDQLDLRPVRGERALLPGAAADHRRRGPARRCSRTAARRRCSELRLHNGTIYRWNRPVYDVVEGVPHLRVENRVLAAGPTVVDTMANAAFYFGLVRTLAEDDRPLWSQMSFSAAEENFHVAAQHGIDARVYWPGSARCRATELVLRRLLPLAHAGLDAWGVEPDEADRLLGIIEQRCVAGRNGASWFVDRVHAHGRTAPTGRGAAADPQGVPRAHARQRARAHLAALSRSGRRAARLPHPPPDALLAADQVDPAVRGEHQNAGSARPAARRRCGRRRTSARSASAVPRSPPPGHPRAARRRSRAARRSPARTRSAAQARRRATGWADSCPLLPGRPRWHVVRQRAPRPGGRARRPRSSRVIPAARSACMPLSLPRGADAPVPRSTGRCAPAARARRALA